MKKPIVLLKGRFTFISLAVAIVLFLTVVIVIYTQNDSVAVFANGQGGSAEGLFNIVNGWVD